VFDDLGVSMIAPDSIGATPVEIRLISLVLLRLVGRSANQTDHLNHRMYSQAESAPLLAQSAISAIGVGSRSYKDTERKLSLVSE